MPSSDRTRASRWLATPTFSRPFIVFAVFGFVLLTTTRLLLVVTFTSLVSPASELPLLFLTGVRFDALLMSYLMLPAWIVVCLVPARSEPAVKAGLRAYFLVALGLMVLLESASWPALREFGSRPEALFLEFLGHPREVAGMIVHGFPIEAAATLLAVVAITAWAWRRLRLATEIPWPTWGRRLLLLPLGAVPLFLGARSSLAHRPANLSSAVFSQNHFHNEIALNSTYTLLYAVYSLRHETDTRRDYGAMATDTVMEIMRRDSGITPADFLAGSASGSSLHRQHPLAPRPGAAPNVVVILLESFGAEYTGRLGGTALTPHFDRLAAEGIAFDQLFSTGTRTSRGIEAVLAGFPPTPARSVMKLGLARKDFFTAPDLFRREGYSTHFIYGGEANFDEMKSFFAGNGVQHIWDQKVLQQPGMTVGVWGIHDEDLFLEADAIFQRQQDQPFFAIILSTSNHTPFDYPPGKIEPDPAFPAASHENAVKFTDHALGQFFAHAKASPYFANTLFLVVADHGTRVSGDQLIPIHKFHIPAFIAGPPDLVTPEVVRALTSQVDLMPTLLALTGREWVHPMIGRNLFASSPAERADPTRGRALLQYETHFGYWTDDDLVILRPGLPAAQFRMETTHRPGAAGFILHPVGPDPDRVDHALAHSLFPRWQYRERLYRLPLEQTASR